jgi:MSHA pilin protein MshA
MIKSKQNGFTLIELVVVIVILGILAAFAVPRFMGLESEARASTLKGLAGSLRAGASMAHAKCQAQACGAAGFITVEGQRIDMVFGYPNATTVERVIQDRSGFTPTNAAGGARRFAKLGAAGANCFVEYVPAAAAGAAPLVRFGVGGAEGTTAFNKALSTACE